MAHFFGIDIGGSNIKIGLVDSEMGLLEKVKYPTKDLHGDEDFVKSFSNILQREFENHPEVEEIGIIDEENQDHMDKVAEVKKARAVLQADQYLSDGEDKKQATVL